MSERRPVRSVLLLCWRDTGHPQGGGSEAYLQRIGTRLAADGVHVTLRTARYPGAPRREVLDGLKAAGHNFSDRAIDDAYAALKRHGGVRDDGSHGVWEAAKPSLSIVRGA